MLKKSNMLVMFFMLNVISGIYANRKVCLEQMVIGGFLCYNDETSNQGEKSYALQSYKDIDDWENKVQNLIKEGYNGDNKYVESYISYYDETKRSPKAYCTDHLIDDVNIPENLTNIH